MNGKYTDDYKTKVQREKHTPKNTKQSHRDERETEKRAVILSQNYMSEKCRQMKLYIPTKLEKTIIKPYTCLKISIER